MSLFAGVTVGSVVGGAARLGSIDTSQYSAVSRGIGTGPGGASLTAPGGRVKWYFRAGGGECGVGEYTVALEIHCGVRNTWSYMVVRRRKDGNYPIKTEVGKRQLVRPARYMSVFVGLRQI